MQGMIVEPGVAPSASRHVVRTWFAGVQFEVHSDHELASQRIADPHAQPRGDEPVLAQVRADVAAQPSRRTLALDAERALHWRWREGRASVRIGTWSFRVSQLGSRSYTAHGVDAGRGLEEILSMVGYPILEREGGLVFHAAGAELDGRAVLFLGPSGAGKSTAVSLVSGARLFAVDRAAVLPSPDGSWWACAIPGGTRGVGVPLSGHRCLPLGGVCVVQGWGSQHEQPTITRLSRVDAGAGLRAALLSNGDISSGLEGWDRLIALSGAVPVVGIRTVRGRDLGAPLRTELWERR